MATTFTNQATLTYNGATVLSNVAVGVMESALAVTKTAVTDAYGPDDSLTYVISLVNSSDTAVSNLTVNDDLGAYPFGESTVQPLSYTSGSVLYYINGALQPAPGVLTADGLSFTGITVPAMGNATLVYSVQVNSYAPLAAGSTITNTVTVTGTSTAEAQETVTAAEEARLSVDKSVTPVPVTENGTLTYTLRMMNAGNTAVTAEDNAVISDVFDPLLSGISVELNGTALTPTDYTYDEVTGAFATVAGVITVPAATYTQNTGTGEWLMAPGTATLTVTGTVSAIG